MASFSSGGNDRGGVLKAWEVPNPKNEITPIPSPPALPKSEHAMYHLGIESSIPKWLESLLPSGARTRFSHVCIDMPAERLQTPFGKSILNENNKRILSVRGDWEDIRYSAVWQHDKTSLPVLCFLQRGALGRVDTS